MSCTIHTLEQGLRASIGALLAGVCLLLATPAAGWAQNGAANEARVLTRLGIPTASLAAIPAHGVKVECGPGAAGATVCEMSLQTDSDEVCRAAAVREGLRQQSDQARSGQQGPVVARARCSAGIVAIFQAGVRRGVMSYKDARGNTARREIPM